MVSAVNAMRAYSSNIFFPLFFYGAAVVFFNLPQPAWAADSQTEKPTVLVVGDSLSAAFGIAQKDGWVQLLQQRLSTRYYKANVVNASISGETTQGGLSRITGLLDKYQPDIVLLELGGNDGLRGLPLSLMKDNLDRIIQIILDRDIKLILVGIELPPNYGPFYTDKFHQIYEDLAEKHAIPLIPFLLKGVATKPDLMQEDGIHPRANAQRMILDNVWPYLKPMIPQVKLK
jgi:acyl-CoA thioesterase-1